MNNKETKDPNEKVAKSIAIERYLVDWVLKTGLPFSCYVRAMVLRRYNEARKRGEEQSELP